MAQLAGDAVGLDITRFNSSTPPISSVVTPCPPPYRVSPSRCMSVPDSLPFLSGFENNEELEERDRPS